jgi:hypothetical protein
MTSIFNRSNPSLSVSFPGQLKPYTADDHITGTVHLRLDRDSNERLELKSVVGKLRVMMVSRIK